MEGKYKIAEILEDKANKIDPDDGRKWSYANTFLKEDNNGEITANIKKLFEESSNLGIDNNIMKDAERLLRISGEYELTEEQATEIWKDRPTKTENKEFKEIVKNSNLREDAELFAYYITSINPETKEYFKSPENLYRVLLRVKDGSRKSNKSPQKNYTPEKLLKPELEKMIKSFPRDTYKEIKENKENEDYNKLRLLIEEKAKKDTMPLFVKDQDLAFNYLDNLIKNEKNKNLVDIYSDLKNIYNGYLDLNLGDVNTEFINPTTDKKGEFPSMHQREALFHINENDRFGIFNGCGTGKTAIGILAQQLYEKKAGKPIRTFIIGPYASLPSWKKALQGEKHERTLRDKQDFLIINEDTIKNEELFNKIKKSKWIFVSKDQLPLFDESDKKYFHQKLEEIGCDLSLFDEGHNLRSYKDITTNKNLTKSFAARSLSAKSRFSLILTGTPMPDKPKDYGVLYSMLNPEECPTPEEFKDKWKNDPRSLYFLVKDKTITRTAEDINDDIKWDRGDAIFNLSDKERKLYDAILDKGTTNYLIQARKALIDPRLVDPEYLEETEFNNQNLLGQFTYEDSSKYKQLEEILIEGPKDKIFNGKYKKKSPIEQKEKFVIFSSMFRDGITTPNNEGLKRKYISLGVRREFNLFEGSLEERILNYSIKDENLNLSQLRKKLSEKNNNSFEEEFNDAISLLKGKNYIQVNEDNIKVNLNKEGSVQKYLNYYYKLGFDKSLKDNLEERLEKEYGRKVNIGVIDGTVLKAKDRANIVTSFNKGELDGLLCTTNTGGESIDLTAASLEIFLDETYSPLTREQAEPRCIRPGQEKVVSIVNLRANDTLEHMTKEGYTDLFKYNDKKRINIKIAKDGHELTDEENQILDDTGMGFGAQVRRDAFGGTSIDVLEPIIDSYTNFEIINTNRRGRKKDTTRPSYREINLDKESTLAQKIFAWIGKDPYGCWGADGFAEEYYKALPTLSPTLLNIARITDLIGRYKEGEIDFPSKILSEGSGPSMLWSAYQDLSKLISNSGLKIPEVWDRDKEPLMLKRGENPNQIVGCMTGNKSKFKESEFDMVDNASIHLLQYNVHRKASFEEANRILKDNGLLELTFKNKKPIKDFYKGLEDLGFNILSNPGDGFQINDEYYQQLKLDRGEHYANSYKSKLNNTSIILAQKEGTPTKKEIRKVNPNVFDIDTSSKMGDDEFSIPINKKEFEGIKEEFGRRGSKGTTIITSSNGNSSNGSQYSSNNHLSKSQKIDQINSLICYTSPDPKTKIPDVSKTNEHRERKILQNKLGRLKKTKDENGLIRVEE